MRLGAGYYRTPDEFLDDVLLIFNNARTYNKPGSDVHVMANTIQVWQLSQPPCFLFVCFSFVGQVGWVCTSWPTRYRCGSCAA